MTSTLWIEIIKELNDSMKRKKKKILLLADNASCHRLDLRPTNIEIKCLPANTTILLQYNPWTKGSSTHLNPTKCLVRKQILALEVGDMRSFLREMNLLPHKPYKTALRRLEFLKEPRRHSPIECDEPVHELSSSGEIFEVEENENCFGELDDNEILNEVRNGEGEIIERKWKISKCLYRNALETTSTVYRIFQ